MQLSNIEDQLVKTIKEKYEQFSHISLQFSCFNTESLDCYAFEGRKPVRLKITNEEESIILKKKENDNWSTLGYL